MLRFQKGRVDFRNYNPLPLISALNLVLQTHAAKTGVRVGGNRYFFKSLNEPTYQLSQGVEAWKRFFISARPTFKQLRVNVSSCLTAFYMPGNLADAISAFERSSSGGMPTYFSRGLKVRITHLGYTRPFKRICGQSARQQKFIHETYGNISVKDYFSGVSVISPLL